jgi:hypothetical protein
VREAARDRPDLVEKVITLGTPVVGDQSTPPPPEYCGVEVITLRR